MVDTKKIETASYARTSASERGVRIELTEIVDRAPGHAPEQSFVVFIRGTAAKLVQARSDPTIKERNHGAHVVGDQTKARQAPPARAPRRGRQ